MIGRKIKMCKKCETNPKNRNTRYCDDWWDDIPHGGYKGDREYKKTHKSQQDVVEEERKSNWGRYE